MTHHPTRHLLVAALPVAVPLTMTTVFAVLRRCLEPRAAYNVGFALYWAGWCLAVPLWLLGPRAAARLLITGRPLPPGHLLLLAAPVAGAVGTQLVPQRRDVEAPTAAVMVGTAVVNAVGEELLWRAVFLPQTGQRPWAMVWSLTGFTLWHFAPQLILPSPLGRMRLVAGSAAVGFASTAAACRAGGLRQAVIAHALADACGVRAARFRIGR